MNSSRRGASRLPVGALAAALALVVTLLAADLLTVQPAAADPAPAATEEPVPMPVNGVVPEAVEEPAVPQPTVAEFSGAPWFKAGTPYHGNFPDPSVLRVGSTYYAYGTNTGGPQLPVMSSTDLRTWVARPVLNPNPSPDPYFNDALPKMPDYTWQDGWDSTNNRKLSWQWAPQVIQIGGTFVLYFATDCNFFGTPLNCIASAVSTSPLGPFVPDGNPPLVLGDGRGSLIDPHAYLAGDGQVYLTWRGPAAASSTVTLWSQRLSPDGRTMGYLSAPVALLAAALPWERNVLENPAMIYYQGRYLLFYSGNWWNRADYGTGVAYCSGPLGPCQRSWIFPFLSSGGTRLGPGGAAPFVDTAGELRLALHAWNAPFSNYPTSTDSGGDQACRDPGPGGNCPNQGQRLLQVDTLRLNPDGSLTDFPDAGAPMPPSPSQKFHSMAPHRLLDTRDRYVHALQLDGGWVVPLAVSGRGGIPTAGVKAVALDVTVANPATAGFITAYPCGTPRPNASSLNMAAGDLQTNLVVAQVGGGDGRVCLFSLGRTDLVVDAVGWYDTASNGQSYTALTPTRVLDSRTGNGWSSPLTPGATRNLRVRGVGGVPDAPGVSTVVLNVTAVQPTQPTYVTAWAAGTPQPRTSNLNVPAGRTMANLVLAPVGANGEISIFNQQGSVDVVADVVGFYSAGGRQFTSFSPSRVLDSRNGVGWTSMLTAGTPQALIVRGAGGVPADPSVSGVALSVTVTMSTTDSHLSVSPSGAPPFSASSLNFRAGQTVSNMVVVPIGPDGAVQLATGAGATHVVVDVVGYYR